MAFNRFVKPGRSQYVSQYVPMKMPFQVWDKKLQQANAKIEQDMLKFKSLGADLGIEGADRFNMGEYGKNYYADTDIGVNLTNTKDLQLGDRQRSINSYNAIMSDINSLSQEEMIKKIGTGEFADNIIKTQQKVQKHKAQNATYKAREEALKDINKTLIDSKDDWLNSPHLRLAIDKELKAMESDPTHIPQNVGVGKYFDRSKYVLDNIKSLKDSGGKSYNLSDPDFIKWSSSRGVSADKYAAFTRDLLNDQGSALYSDVEKELNAMKQAGFIKSLEDEKKARLSIEAGLVETAKNLEHRVSDQGMTEKSQGLKDQEAVARFATASEGIDFEDIQKGTVSVTEMVGKMSALQTRKDLLEKELKSNTLDYSTRNKYKAELADIEKQETALNYNKTLLENAINEKLNYETINNTILPLEAELLAVQNGDIYKSLFVESTDAQGNTTYEFNPNADLDNITQTLAVKYAEQNNIPVEQARQEISNNKAFQYAIQEASTLGSEEVSKRIKNHETVTAFDAANNLIDKSGSEVKYQRSNNSYRLIKDGSVDYQTMETYLNTQGVNISGTPGTDSYNSQILEKFDDTYGTIYAGVISIRNRTSNVQNKREDLEAQKEALYNSPIAGVGQVDISTPPAIVLDNLPSEMINATYNNLSAADTELSVNGRIVSNNQVKQVLLAEIMKEGADFGGSITGDGGIVLQGSTKSLLTTDSQLEEIFAKTTGVKREDDQEEYEKWLKQYTATNSGEKAYTIKMVPASQQSKYNNIKYAQDSYLKSNNTPIEKSINTSLTNIGTYNAINGSEGITKTNQELVVTVDERMKQRPSEEGEDLLQSMVNPINKSLTLNYVTEDGRTVPFVVDVISSKVTDPGNAYKLPDFEYRYYDYLAGQEFTIPVTGSDGNNLVEQILLTKYEE